MRSDQLEVETLKSKLEELDLESRQKGDELRNLSNISQNLEKEKCELISSNKDVADRLEMAHQEVKNLHDFVNFLAMKLTELDDQSRTFSEKVIHLNALFDNWFKMVHEEKELAAQHAGNKFDQLHNQYTCVVSERNSLQLSNQDLNDKVIALQKDQEYAMVQHAEECHLTEEKIRKLESEIENLCSKKMELELLVTKLQGDIETLSENSKLSEKNKVKLFHNFGFLCDTIWLHLM